MPIWYFTRLSFPSPWAAASPLISPLEMMNEMSFYSPEIGKKGLTPLHYYCWWYHPPAIKWALKNGGDINAVDDVYKQTPLLMLGKIYNGSLKRKKHCFRLLVNAGADIFAVGDNGSNLLQEVKEMGSKGFQRFLKSEFKRRKNHNKKI